MRVAIFSTHQFERPFLEAANDGQHELIFHRSQLHERTAALAADCEAVSVFTNDDVGRTTLEQLAKQSVKLIALRSAGYNNVDLEAANELGIRVVRVPAYSPYAVAEFAVTMMLTLNRRVIRAHHRITDLNFSLDGLTGFDVHGKTAGIVGTGKIGGILARILHGFGCELLGTDPYPNEALTKDYGLEYVEIDVLCQRADVIFLLLPLNEDTHYLINAERIRQMKPGVMLINTGRGGLVQTTAVVDGLKTGHIGYFGMDVYEEEDGLFFEDHSDEDLLQDDTIARLMSFRNVLITSHQAFLTDTALRNIAETTIENLSAFSGGKDLTNEVQV
ncbi:2-hydroxyacid dehydrogenase [Lewinella sp. W8]|uniref:2-hydroxyacid dehydrogenase n=1 Tax=Lewinella sp. W8 TaxID=2528208 RepID=UPI001067FA95|nr:2-hydroxyacid dehydrogenase [Lewinella sp. W8]